MDDRLKKLEEESVRSAAAAEGIDHDASVKAGYVVNAAVVDINRADNDMTAEAMAPVSDLERDTVPMPCGACGATAEWTSHGWLCPTEGCVGAEVPDHVQLHKEWESM